MHQIRNLIVVTCALVTMLMLESSAYSQPTMSVTRIATGFSRPVSATTVPGGTGRLFVTEQFTGRIRILDLDTLTINPTPFLDINGLSTTNEQGLLALAFHPNYANNGRLYVNFTNTAGTTIIREYLRLNANQADPSTARDLLTIAQPFPNHNGGWMGFDANNRLYIATGDGGAGGDPGNRSQNLNQLLGKLLRINPTGNNSPNGQYGIPASNPFVGVTGRDEIWAYGLRNPWRCSFDSLTGDLYIADVGQGEKEEISVQPGASTGGENYGWRPREGTIPYPGVGGGVLPGAIDPIYDYDHGFGDLEGISVTGGYVYRGPIAELQGHYFFADYGSDRIWSLKWDGSAPSTHDGTNYTSFIDWTDVLTTNIGSIGTISSFAEDSLGNLYILDLNGGEIFRIDSATIATPVAPDSYERTDGILVSGGVEELLESDDEDLVIRPFGAGSAQFTIKGVSPYANPSAIEICLESSVTPILSNVTQTIELFDYVAQDWVEIDSRQAARVNDDTAIVAAPGDLTRFVEADTLCVEARVGYKSVNPRRRFVSGTDQFKWAISP